VNSLLTWGARPLLNLLWLLPLLGALLFWTRARRRRDLARIAAAPVLRGLAPADLAARRAWQAVLLSLGFGLLLVAAARPQLGFQWRDVERHGVDIAVVVDVSRSMDAQDVSPSRMERARREVLDLCAALPGDRLGLVVFAAGAYPRVPLTLDHDALLTILEEVDTTTLQAQGTSLPAALDEALLLLQNDDNTDKAILLLTDGEVPDAEAAVAAAERVAAAQVSIFAMGVGTSEGAPILVEGGGFKKDRQGQVVVSRLDEPLLRRLAARAGGAYVRSIASAEDVDALVGQVREQTEGQLLGVHREKVPNEHYQWPLGTGLVVFALGLFVGAPGRVRVAPAALVLLLLTAPRAEAGDRADGLAALAAGEYERAADLLMDQYLARPDDLDLSMSLGQALLLSGRPNEAERVWEQVAERATEPRLRALARYDMGHAAYQGGRLVEAREHFLRAAEIDKELAAAAKNAEAVAREIAARTKDPEQPPQKPCDNPQGGEKDGQRQPGDQGDPSPGQDQQDQQEQASQSGSAGEREPASGDGQRPDGGPQPPMEGDIQPATGLSGEEGAPTPGLTADVPTGQLDPQQAAALLESVEEGSPRVVVRGQPDREQDW
jgi:Ca-activated chloride channel family protein